MVMGLCFLAAINNASCRHLLIVSRAMLSPPRLPAFHIAFNACAWPRSEHARTGLKVTEKYSFKNAKACSQNAPPI
jgi:hypothetical protein